MWGERAPGLRTGSALLSARRYPHGRIRTAVSARPYPHGRIRTVNPAETGKSDLEQQIMLQSQSTG